MKRVLQLSRQALMNNVQWGWRGYFRSIFPLFRRRSKQGFSNWIWALCEREVVVYGNSWISDVDVHMTYVKVLETGNTG